MVSWLILDLSVVPREGGGGPVVAHVEIVIIGVVALASEITTSQGTGDPASPSTARGPVSTKGIRTTAATVVNSAANPPSLTLTYLSPVIAVMVAVVAVPGDLAQVSSRGRAVAGSVRISSYVQIFARIHIGAGIVDSEGRDSSWGSDSASFIRGGAWDKSDAKVVEIATETTGHAVSEGNGRTPGAGRRSEGGFFPSSPPPGAAAVLVAMVLADGAWVAIFAGDQE
ncbi:hypothetical protein PG984_002894 [Apiospora sp. TS-2023a]